PVHGRRWPACGRRRDRRRGADAGRDRRRAAADGPPVRRRGRCAPGGRGHRHGGVLAPAERQGRARRGGGAAPPWRRRSSVQCRIPADAARAGGFAAAQPVQAGVRGGRRRRRSARAAGRGPPPDRGRGGRDAAGLRGGVEARHHPRRPARNGGDPPHFGRGSGVDAIRRGTMTDTIFTLHRGNAPLLVSLPHDGSEIPKAMAARMTPAARRAPDTDWHVGRLYAFAMTLGASVLAPCYSRYVVDLNRPPDDTSLYPGQNTTGLCPLRQFSDEPVYREGQEPDEEEVRARVERYWRPYHDCLQAELARIRSAHG